MKREMGQMKKELGQMKKKLGENQEEIFIGKSEGRVVLVKNILILVSIKRLEWREHFLSLQQEEQQQTGQERKASLDRHFLHFILSLYYI
jgi:hypothetical protein